MLEPGETPSERLRLAFDLVDVAERLLRERLRRETPAVSDDVVESRVAEWYASRPGAEWGDGDGIAAVWPRR